MISQDIEEKIKQIMSNLFSMDLIDIGPDSSIETIEDWDSLQHVNLIMSLEQEFGVRIDVEDAVEMISFTCICDKLAGYLEGTT